MNLVQDSADFVGTLPKTLCLPNLLSKLESAFDPKQTFGDVGRTAKGTVRSVNRCSGMTYHSDRPYDQLKVEARRFQEKLRRALATPPGKSKPTK